jgi:hypothetical protein
LLNRIIPLLRTGGWLVLEDHDLNFHSNSKLGNNPATVKVLECMHAATMNRHVQSGHRPYDEMLRIKGVFSEIHTRIIPFHLSASSEGE